MAFASSMRRSSCSSRAATAGGMLDRIGCANVIGPGCVALFKREHQPNWVCDRIPVHRSLSPLPTKWLEPL